MTRCLEPVRLRDDVIMEDPSMVERTAGCSPRTRHCPISRKTVTCRQMLIQFPSIMFKWKPVQLFSSCDVPVRQRTKRSYRFSAMPPPPPPKALQQQPGSQKAGFHAVKAPAPVNATLLMCRSHRYFSRAHKQKSRIHKNRRRGVVWFVQATRNMVGSLVTLTKVFQL